MSRARKRLLAGAVGLAAAGLFLARPISAPLPDKIHLAELTWVELRELIDSGRTTVIVPTAGFEQNGPHMIFAKHRYVVRETTDRIARALGNALVAPVLDLAPEGAIDPPEGHMAFPGTISLPEPVFGAVLEYVARSLRAAGFRTVLFIGDHGQSQATQAAVAERLDRAWAAEGVRVFHIGDYYAANGQTDWLRAEGESETAIGRHAGIRDTSELMAVYPDGVRADRMAPFGGLYLAPTGVDGDPTRATAARGERLIALKVEAAVRQIRRLTGSGS